MLISVESPDPARAQELLDSVQLAPVDHNGCWDKVDMATTPVGDRSGLTDALVPPAPLAASICRYSADWLGYSAGVPEVDLGALVQMFNALPVGASTGPVLTASNDSRTTKVSDELVNSLLVRVGYDDVVIQGSFSRL